MLTRIEKKLTSYQPITAILVTKLVLVTLLFSAPAKALTGGEVVNKMTAEERNAYFAGVVAGLAQAKWLVDKPNVKGLECINDWYYEGGAKVHKTIDAWLRRHPDKAAGGLLYILIKKECGNLID